MAKQRNVIPVPVTQHALLAVGVPAGKAGSIAVKRAVETLRRDGYGATVLLLGSADTILAAAKYIDQIKTQIAEEQSDGRDNETHG